MEISDVEKAVITRILKEEMGVSITSLELEALISIGERGSVDEKTLASLLGVDEEFAGYILGKLQENGLITKT